MPLLARLRSVWRTLADGRNRDRDLDEELRSYVDELVDREAARGGPRDAARRSVLAGIGGVEHVKERVRDVRLGIVFDTVLRDLSYGCRTLLRTPLFATTVILTLALGIGANVTMFSVVRAVLWQPLPYPLADRLVLLSADARGLANAGLTEAELDDLRGQTDVFDHVAKIVGVNAHLDIDGDLEHATAASANDRALALLGATPLALGRPLEAAKDLDVQAEFVAAVVISDRLWRSRFASDPNVVGRRIQVNNLDVQVVGVLRPDLRVFMPADANTAEEIDIWFPRPFNRDRREGRGHSTIARLRPGVSLDTLQTRLDVLSERFVAAHPEDYTGGAFRLSARALQDVVTAGVRPALFMLAGAVAFVLLIGCVNVANLMIARAGARRQEFAMRRALGAGRSRLIRQLLTESAVLAACGALAGVLLAFAGVRLVDWLRPTHLPRQSQIAIDGAAVWFTLALTVGATIMFGLAQVWRSNSGDADALRASRSGTQASGTRRLQRILVVTEVALSVVPLVAAGLMLRTFVNLVNAPIGFNPEHVLTAKMPYSHRAFPDTERQLAFYAQAMDAVRRLPGVDDVSAGRPLPLEPWQLTRNVAVEADPTRPLARVTVQSAQPGYLRVMGITLREGRDVSDDDLVSRRRVAIVDERLARRLWPEGALGRRLVMGDAPRQSTLEVIGVSSPVRVTRVRDDAMLTIVVPYHAFGLEHSLVVKTRESAASLGPAIKQAVEALGTRRPVYDILPMQAYVDRSIGDARFTTLVLAGFAGAALLLTAVGLYGTLAYLISQRTPEFGVRMALGASAGRVARMVGAEAALLTAFGAVAGMAGAGAVAGTLAGLLYEVTPFDATTIALVAALLALVAIVAASGPAWRAARVDPSVALRAE